MRFVVVTGANKGIGYGIVKGLLSNSSVSSRVYLTSRDEERGKRALEQVVAETKHLWAPETSVEYHQLDITSDTSISAFTTHLLEKFGQKCVNILIDNAGYASKGPEFSGDIVKQTMDINYFGTVKFTERMMDLMSTDSKVIILSSVLGKLYNVPEKLQHIYSDPNLTMDQLNHIQHDFVQAAYEGTCKEKGYSTNSYSFSKVAISAYARVLARRFAADPRRIFIASCHPGWIRTDMGGQNAPHDVDYGIKTPLYLVNEYIKNLLQYSGNYFSESKVEEW
ncbi:hypothetical protein BB561_002745 [Smittium simulii]|uniref:Carbonyl reductase [NADPH] 1 n=1 Tax=Smittium simulii TaxID=133385 RepID=A0A2T9YPG7_9FUNG|nr:hypothetical protein BB561_002745 [Smittium simulii]